MIFIPSLMQIIMSVLKLTVRHRHMSGGGTTCQYFLVSAAICGRGELHTRFWWGKLRKGEHLEDLPVDGRITLKCLWDGRGGMDWIDPAHDMCRWWLM
jgi:hypothetical protein